MRCLLRQRAFRQILKKIRLYVANHRNLYGVPMAGHDIQKSKNLLKRLDEEMIFLGSLTSQVILVSSNIKGTWSAIDTVHKNWEKGKEEEKS